MRAASVFVSFVLALSLLAGPALAQDSSRDRVVFGGDVHVAAMESVQSVTAFGGDVQIDGEVLGDVVALGGDVSVAPGARVHGSVSSLGGSVEQAPGSYVARPSEFSADASSPGLHFEEQSGGIGDALGDALRSAVAHGLLFLLALLMIGFVPERLGALQVTMVRDPLRTFSFGVAGYVAAIAAIVALAITIIGIPAAVVVGLGLPVVTWVGLASAATVIGAALPMTKLRGRPILQVGAGVLVLWVASMVPFFGGIVIAIAACFGLGALVRTRFRTDIPEELRGLGPVDGPYRSASV